MGAPGRRTSTIGKGGVISAGFFDPGGVRMSTVIEEEVGGGGYRGIVGVGGNASTIGLASSTTKLTGMPGVQGPPLMPTPPPTVSRTVSTATGGSASTRTTRTRSTRFDNGSYYSNGGVDVGYSAIGTGWGGGAPNNGGSTEAVPTVVVSPVSGGKRNSSVGSGGGRIGRGSPEMHLWVPAEDGSGKVHVEGK